MCSIGEKEELEALKIWKQEASQALLTLQTQVKSLVHEVESIKHNLEFREEEIKSLRRVLGITQGELSLSPQRLKSRSSIMLGVPRVSSWSEPDKPQGTVPPPYPNHATTAVDQLNIGHHKISSNPEADLSVLLPDSVSSSYEEIRSPHASSLQMISLQTFASIEGADNSTTNVPPLALEPTADTNGIVAHIPVVDIPQQAPTTEVPNSEAQEFPMTQISENTNGTHVHTETQVTSTSPNTSQETSNNTETSNSATQLASSTEIPQTGDHTEIAPTETVPTDTTVSPVIETTGTITSADVTLDADTLTSSSTTADSDVPINSSGEIGSSGGIPIETTIHSLSDVVEEVVAASAQESTLPASSEILQSAGEQAVAAESVVTTDPVLEQVITPPAELPIVPQSPLESTPNESSSISSPTPQTPSEQSTTTQEPASQPPVPESPSPRLPRSPSLQSLPQSPTAQAPTPLSPTALSPTPDSPTPLSPTPQSPTPLSPSFQSHTFQFAKPEHEQVIEAIPDINLPEESSQSDHPLTPQIKVRDLRPRNLIATSRAHLSIEIPNSAFGSPRTYTPNSASLSSPHIPSAPVNTPDGTPVSTPTGDSTPKLHLTRPKLPTRDELKAKGSTLKRTHTISRGDSLNDLWAGVTPDTPTTPPSPTSPTDVGELYSKFGSDASDSDSLESPHRLRLSMSEERIYSSSEKIYSPESSDSEDSFLKIKGKYATSKLTADALHRYELDTKRVILAQKVIRGWIHRRRLEKIRKRTEATKELLTTELGYAKCLDSLIHHYVKPLRSNSTSTHAYILPSQVDDIFSTIEDIKQASAMMLVDLDNMMKSWNYFSNVGSLMLSHVDNLQPHLPFVVNYEKSQQVVALCSKNKEFANFLKRRMSSAELDYKTLDDFLILPVQRIPRYIMLLEAIYKYTPVSHPDREGVKKAAHQMRLLAEKINKRKASAAKFAEFCSCLKGYVDGEIKQESRYLVREGSVSNEKRRPRYAALMNDLLVVCKPPEVVKSSKKDAPKKPTYKFVAQIKLEATTNLQVRPCGAANSSGITPYIIILKNATSSITIITGSEDGKGWTKDVHSVLETLRKKK